jgi:hypothetical protein
MACPCPRKVCSSERRIVESLEARNAENVIQVVESEDLRYRGGREVGAVLGGGRRRRSVILYFCPGYISGVGGNLVLVMIRLFVDGKVKVICRCASQEDSAHAISGRENDRPEDITYPNIPRDTDG